jgi:hypothetical protein
MFIDTTILVCAASRQKLNVSGLLTRMYLGRGWSVQQYAAHSPFYPGVSTMSARNTLREHERVASSSAVRHGGNRL